MMLKVAAAMRAIIRSDTSSSRFHRDLTALSILTQPRGLFEHRALGNALVVGRREGCDRHRRHQVRTMIGRRHTIRALPGMTDAKAVRRSDIHHQAETIASRAP